MCICKVFGAIFGGGRFVFCLTLSFLYRPSAPLSLLPVQTLGVPFLIKFCCLLINFFF